MVPPPLTSGTDFSHMSYPWHVLYDILLLRFLQNQVVEFDIGPFEQDSSKMRILTIIAIFSAVNDSQYAIDFQPWLKLSLLYHPASVHNHQPWTFSEALLSLSWVHLNKFASLMETNSIIIETYSILSSGRKHLSQLGFSSPRNSIFKILILRQNCLILITSLILKIQSTAP